MKKELYPSEVTDGAIIHVHRPTGAIDSFLIVMTNVKFHTPGKGNTQFPCVVWKWYDERNDMQPYCETLEYFVSSFNEMVASSNSTISIKEQEAEDTTATGSLSFEELFGSKP